MPNLSEIFAEMQNRANQNPGKIEGMNATYQFELSGEGGGNFFFRVADGKAEAGEGVAAGAGCTVQMSATDFQALVAGQLNATAAFMSGKLKIKGDMGLALKLQSLL